jgi:hypothetical protein
MLWGVRRAGRPSFACHAVYALGLW